MGQAHGDIWWTELMANDIGKSAKFYQKLLGWTPFVASMEDMKREAKPGEPSYTMFMKDGQPVCGGMAMSQAGLTGVPPHWFTYVAVKDVDAACKSATAAGGTIMRPPWDIPGVGRIAVIKDADGAAIGLGTPVANE
jgi:uncharacterized protein